MTEKNVKQIKKNVYVCMAASLCCIVDIEGTLQINYTLINKRKFIRKKEKRILKKNVGVPIVAPRVKNPT